VDEWCAAAKEALRRLAGGETQADVARTYNVDATTIGRLLGHRPFHGGANLVALQWSAAAGDAGDAEQASARGGVPPHSKNESVRPWRLRVGPVCASLPNDFGVDPGTVQRISRPFAAPSVVAAVP
jgi:hypothetical protein